MVKDKDWIWLQVSSLPLTGGVTLDKLLNLSMPQFSHM